MLAIQQDDIDTVRKLIEHGVNVNYEAQDFVTALSLAKARTDRLGYEMLQQLRKAGAKHISE